MNDSITLPNGVVPPDVWGDEATNTAPTTPAAPSNVSVKVDTKSMSPAELMQHALIFDDTEIEPETYLLRRGDANLLPLKNVSILKAQMKSGKSFVASLFASAVLAGKWEGDLHTPTGIDNCSVLYVDTEQSKPSTQKIRRRISRLYEMNTDSTDDVSNVLHDRLYVANVRAYDVKQRIDTVELILQTYRDKIKFVVLDGIRDICNNFNDIQETADTMQTVTRWALEYNVHIMCILHENPNSDKARGHLGTELYNKATEIVDVSKTDCGNFAYFTIKWDAIRDSANVNEILFKIEGDLENIPVPQPLNKDDEDKIKEYEQAPKPQKPRKGKDGKQGGKNQDRNTTPPPAEDSEDDLWKYASDKYK